jgi:hypothetical protein
LDIATPVKSSWKNPLKAAQMLKPLNALVKGEIFEGKRLTTERIIELLLVPDLFAFDPVGEVHEVVLQLCDVKVLNEHKDVPESSWPLYVTKPTFGPITIHCRPERTSLLGALIKICPQDMIRTEDDFRVIRENVRMVNAALSSLADRYDEDEGSNKKTPASQVHGQLALAL